MHVKSLLLTITPYFWTLKIRQDCFTLDFFWKANYTVSKKKEKRIFWKSEHRYRSTAHSDAIKLSPESLARRLRNESTCNRSAPSLRAGDKSNPLAGIVADTCNEFPLNGAVFMGVVHRTISGTHQPLPSFPAESRLLVLFFFFSFPREKREAAGNRDE